MSDRARFLLGIAVLLDDDTLRQRDRVYWTFRAREEAAFLIGWEAS